MYIVDTPVENLLYNIQRLIKIICTFIPRTILEEVHLLEVIAVASSSKSFAQYLVQLYQVLQYSEYFLANMIVASVFDGNLGRHFRRSVVMQVARSVIPYLIK